MIKLKNYLPRNTNTLAVASDFLPQAQTGHNCIPEPPQAGHKSNSPLQYSHGTIFLPLQ